ncbi:MAG: hypothetical protein WAW96_16770 [Alphaproteobacteria bacterium]
MNDNRADLSSGVLQHHLVRGLWIAFLSGLAALALTMLASA